jgi:hypothetical protein
MNNEIRKKLAERLNNEENALIRYVISDILDKENVVQYMKDVLHHGCVSGIVNGLIYYHDTHKFYDYHYEEIEELRLDLLKQGIDMLEYIGENDFKNHMSWMAYEETVRQIAEELEVLV